MMLFRQRKGDIVTVADCIGGCVELSKCAAPVLGPCAVGSEFESVGSGRNILHVKAVNTVHSVDGLVGNRSRIPAFSVEPAGSRGAGFTGHIDIGHLNGGLADAAAAIGGNSRGGIISNGHITGRHHRECQIGTLQPCAIVDRLELIRSHRHIVVHFFEYIAFERHGIVRIVRLPFRTAKRRAACHNAGICPKGRHRQVQAQKHRQKNSNRSFHNDPSCFIFCWVTLSMTNRNSFFSHFWKIL